MLFLKILQSKSNQEYKSYTELLSVNISEAILLQCQLIKQRPKNSVLRSSSLQAAEEPFWNRFQWNTGSSRFHFTSGLTFDQTFVFSYCLRSRSLKNSLSVLKLEPLPVNTQFSISLRIEFWVKDPVLPIMLHASVIVFVFTGGRALLFRVLFPRQKFESLRATSRVNLC